MSYTGYIHISVEDPRLASVYENINVFSMLPNQYLIVTDSDKCIEKFRWTGNEYARLSYVSIPEFKPLSAKQYCLSDMLSNFDIPVRIITGVAGSGKTKMTVKYGLHFLEKGKISKIFFTRHNSPIGEPIGATPGSVNEKVRVWLGCLADNLDDYVYTIEEMLERDMLEVDAIAMMKGRDLKNCWIIVDEAEDLTANQFKMLGERCSSGSVINFIGDTGQITQEKYKRDNGLNRAIDSLKGNPLVSMLSFNDPDKDNFRSKASKVFTNYY